MWTMRDYLARYGTDTLHDLILVLSVRAPQGIAEMAERQAHFIRDALVDCQRNSTDADAALVAAKSEFEATP